MQESTFFVCTHVRGPGLTAVCYSEVTGPRSASEGTSHVEMLTNTMKNCVCISALAAGVKMAEQTEGKVNMDSRAQRKGTMQKK